MRNQLRRVADWAGMAHSLEIRVPLVDIMLLRRVAPPLGTKHRPTKLGPARTLATPLPVEVLQRPKSGFLVPVQRWLAAASDQGAAEGPRLASLGQTSLPASYFQLMRILCLLTEPG